MKVNKNLVSTRMTSAYKYESDGTWTQLHQLTEIVITNLFTKYRSLSGFPYQHFITIMA